MWRVLDKVLTWLRTFAHFQQQQKKEEINKIISVASSTK